MITGSVSPCGASVSISRPTNFWWPSTMLGLGVKPRASMTQFASSRVPFSSVAPSASMLATRDPGNSVMAGVAVVRAACGCVMAVRGVSSRPCFAAVLWSHSRSLFWAALRAELLDYTNRGGENELWVAAEQG